MPAIQYREGFITLAPQEQGLYLDTLRAEGHQTIPTLLGFTPHYVLGFDGCGQVYVAPRASHSPVKKPAFAIKQRNCTGPLLDPRTNLVVVDSQTVVLLHQTDGLFSSARVQVVLVALSKTTSQIVDIGKSIRSLSYSPTTNTITYQKDGTEVKRLLRKWPNK